MIAAEEFTFPVISSNATDTVNLALLPPLWRISDSDETSSAARQRRPFASQIIKTDDEAEKGQGAEAEAESQEKMDLLWEDFNEELQSSADSSGSEFSEETSQHHCDEFEDLEECAKSNVRQLKLIRAKPKKMESLVKVMKKLFWLSNQQKSNHQ